MLEDLLRKSESELLLRIKELELQMAPLSDELNRRRLQLTAIREAMKADSAGPSPIRALQDAPPYTKTASGSLADQAFRILSDAGEPLHYQEMTARVAAAGFDIPGKNPAANLLAQISRRRDIVRVARGTYAIRGSKAQPKKSVRRRTSRRSR